MEGISQLEMVIRVNPRFPKAPIRVGEAEELTGGKVEALT